MSIFGKIMDKIFHRGGAKPAATTGAAPPMSPPPGNVGAGTAKPAATAAAAKPAAAQPPASVDVEAVLTELAASKGGGNWQTSIVDLLKLLDLDSSLEARKELAQELNVNAGAHGSAEQNMALQKAVMRQLAANGGKVPASLRD